MTVKEYGYWFGTINGVGLKTMEKLLEHFGSAEHVFYAQKKDIMKMNGLTEQQISEIIKSRNEDQIKERYAKLLEEDIYFVSKEENSFPKRLRNIALAPFCLYYKGELPKEESLSIAIVGARNCSNYGKEVARCIAKDLSDAGVQVISGMARGIDGFAHEGALLGHTDTFAILGSGIDVCYPKENLEIYTKIQKKGGVITEYPPKILPIAGNFPMRNRIISGLSDGVVVIEARERSGSLITADLSLEQGKDIFALPGRAFDNLSKGCNNLIKMGAILVENARDILENYHIFEGTDSLLVKKNYNLLETTEKIVYACLSLYPKHVNEIMRETGISLIDVIECLIALEEKSFIKQIIKNYYVISNE